VVIVKVSGAPPILEFMQKSDGRGDITGSTSSSLLITRGLQFNPSILNHLPDASWPFVPHYPSYGSHKICCRSSREHILHHTRGNGQYSSCFLAQHELPEEPHHYETNSSGWYALHNIFRPTPSIGPVPCAFRLHSQHFKVIPENTGIHQFTWEHLNNVNCVSTCQKVGRNILRLKMTIKCVPEVMAMFIAALTRDVTL